MRATGVMIAAAVVASLLHPAVAGAEPDVTTPTVADRTPDGPVLTQLTEFGTGLASGSTIGPDGALYVTDPNAGSVLRVDRRTGVSRTYAGGLPPQVLGVGGAMDVEFIGRTAYVLVTLVGGDIVGGPPIGDATVGIYRLGRDGDFRVIADIGEWSVDHPPDTDFFITTGVQYALQRQGRGFLVTDGHHNRLLRVGRHGHISEALTFGNVVPTGLETIGPVVLTALAGPLPHEPQDGRIVALGCGSAPPSTSPKARACSSTSSSVLVSVSTHCRRVDGTASPKGPLPHRTRADWSSSTATGTWSLLSTPTGPKSCSTGRPRWNWWGTRRTSSA